MVVYLFSIYYWTFLISFLATKKMEIHYYRNWINILWYGFFFVKLNCNLFFILYYSFRLWETTPVVKPCWLPITEWTVILISIHFKKWSSGINWVTFSSLHVRLTSIPMWGQDGGCVSLMLEFYFGKLCRLLMKHIAKV